MTPGGRRPRAVREPRRASAREELRRPTRSHPRADRPGHRALDPGTDEPTAKVGLVREQARDVRTGTVTLLPPPCKGRGRIGITLQPRQALDVRYAASGTGPAALDAKRVPLVLPEVVRLGPVVVRGEKADDAAPWLAQGADDLGPSDEAMEARHPVQRRRPGEPFDRRDRTLVVAPSDTRFDPIRTVVDDRVASVKTEAKPRRRLRERRFEAVRHVLELVAVVSLEQVQPHHDAGSAMQRTQEAELGLDPGIVARHVPKRRERGEHVVDAQLDVA